MNLRTLREVIFMEDRFCLYGYEPDNFISNEVLKYSKKRTYKPNEYITYQGDTEDKSLYLLLSGKIEVSRICKDGQKIILGFYTKQLFFGESAFSDFPRFVSTRTLEKTKVAVLTLESLAQLNPELREKLVFELFNTHINKFNGILELMEDLRTVKLKHRIWNTLTSFAADAPTFIENKKTFASIKVTHQELSEIVGASRANVTSELSALRDSGLIQLHRNKIDIRINYQ